MSGNLAAKIEEFEGSIFYQITADWDCLILFLNSCLADKGLSNHLCCWYLLIGQLCPSVFSGVGYIAIGKNDEMLIPRLCRSFTWAFSFCRVIISHVIVRSRRSLTGNLDYIHVSIDVTRLCKTLP